MAYSFLLWISRCCPYQQTVRVGVLNHAFMICDWRLERQLNDGMCVISEAYGVRCPFAVQ
jgi:hypothetical protein